MRDKDRDRDREHAMEIGRLLERSGQRMQDLARNDAPTVILSAEFALALSLIAKWIKVHHFGDIPNHDDNPERN